MESDWLPDAQVRAMLAAAAGGNPHDLIAFVGKSKLRATDSEYSCLVLIRDHDAWFIDGWHDANAPMARGGKSLQMINFYDESFWSKLPVPNSARVRSLRWVKTHFVFKTSRGDIKSTPQQLQNAVFDSMTGRALSDEMIEHNFGKLDGSVPLDNP